MLRDPESRIWGLESRRAVEGGVASGPNHLAGGRQRRRWRLGALPKLGWEKAVSETETTPLEALFNLCG